MNPVPHKAAKRQAELAVDVVRRIAEAVAAGAPADVTLAAFFRERRYLGSLVFSYFRWKGWTGGLEERDPGTVCAVAYCLDAMEPHAAADLLRPGLEPMGAASLDEKASALARWLGLERAPEVEALVPAWVQEALPSSSFAECVRAFQVRPPTWLRLARGHKAAVLEELARRGIEYTPHADVSSAIAVSGSSGLAAVGSEVKPFFAIQDLASQRVGLACAPEPGERWWDLCAGAGGKSLHLADLMGNQGTILASDVRGAALEELRRRAERAGVTCIRTEGRHGSSRALFSASGARPSMTSSQGLSAGMEGRAPSRPVRPATDEFDGVLVDAPCSGLGTWSRNPDARWRTNESDITGSAVLQAELLRQAADHVRPGGRLLYSVCTVTMAETTGVIEPFLKERPDFQMESDGITWVWPWDGPCDGMFIARLERQN